MEQATQRTRPVYFLTGIGLVLVGLLSGILVMLLLADSRPPSASPPQIVERVELGRPAALRPAPPADSAVALPSMDLRQLNHLFKGVAGQVTPAVVFIQVEVPLSRDMPADWFHNFDERDEYELRELPRQSVGSGVIISDQGYVITNNHVVDRAENIVVTLADKRQYEAEVVGIDPSTDLAVIKVNARGQSLPVVALGDSDDLEVGEWVLAVGNPFRLTSTVTAGIVSALGRQVGIIDDPLRIEDFIQTDAAINPGNSGGALVNLQGELVGISTAIATESGSYEGYGFAVPVNLMERVARDLIAHGEVRRGYLGVTIQGIDAGSARRLGLDQIGGVYLREVEQGGAADRGGLRQGDVVLAINGRIVNAPNELQSSIARYRPGDQVSVEVWRRGVRKAFQVELVGKEDPVYRRWLRDLGRAEESEPVPEPQQPSNEVFALNGWGLGLRDLTQRERDGFDIERGVYLAYVEKESVADEAGLPRDVIIERVGDEPVTSVEEAVRQFSIAAEQADAVLVRVRRRSGLSSFYEIDIPRR